jgi:hypothetical protein
MPEDYKAKKRPREDDLTPYEWAIYYEDETVAVCGSEEDCGATINVRTERQSG